MHTNPETLGDIIKYYREKSNYTVESLSNIVGISERYLYRIENENKKPSFEVLYKLVRALSISSDMIFYPEMMKKNIKLDRLYHMLLKCNDKDIGYIEIIIAAMLSNADCNH